MYPTEVLAMMVVFASMTFISSVLVVATAWLANSITQKILAFRRHELELRRWEIESRMAQERLVAGVPAGIDPSNAADVIAWSHAVAEIGRIEPQRALAAARATEGLPSAVR
jgi:hypothetical protein